LKYDVQNNNARKWLGLLAAIVLYYIVHEGAHVISALLMGKYEGIRIMAWGLGVQVLADAASMSDIQFFIFNIAGIFATMIAAYILIWRRQSILRTPSKVLRAIAYYATFIFLCLDPLYLSVIYRFVGGGDMNGILRIGIPEAVVFNFFLAMLCVNIVVFVKFVYPAYKQRFSQDPVH
jgi:hypothetical protein